MAYENGIYYFDTGDAFNNGKSESLLGLIIKKQVWPRNSFVVSTKLFWSHSFDHLGNKNKRNYLKSVSFFIFILMKSSFLFYC